MSVLRRIVLGLDSRIKYYIDKKCYIRRYKGGKFEFKKEYEKKCYYDRYGGAGELDPHYFLQDIYVANKIIQSQLKLHHDIGSRVDGFISHLLAANVNVNMIDIRPLPYQISGLNFVEGNATNLNNIQDESLESLSSLHAVEHFGLGRYGDPISPNGWKKALMEYVRVLKKGGKLYLSVPIGAHDKLCFNAHRVFHPETIVKSLHGMDLDEFTYIKNMKIYSSKNFKDCNFEENDYLCGIFIFSKKK